MTALAAARRGTGRAGRAALRRAGRGRPGRRAGAGRPARAVAVRVLGARELGQAALAATAPPPALLRLGPGSMCCMRRR